MLLTQEQIEYQAQKASWYVEVNTRDLNFGSGDGYIVTGDGVEDLDRLISLMPIYPNGQFSIDVGTQYSSFRPCDIEDIQAIRAAYIEFYGTVNKPGFPPVQSEAFEL